MRHARSSMRDGRVLIAQRPQGKADGRAMGVPGGKIENGERPEETSIRGTAARSSGITVERGLVSPRSPSRATLIPDFHLLMPL